MSNNKSKIFIKYIFLLSAFFFCSCDTKQIFPGLWPSPTPTLSPELMDRSWLTGIPCSPPCWYGLEIGKTTPEEAQEKINQLSFIEANVTKWDNISVPLYCKGQNYYYCAELRFDDNILSEIGIFPNYEITLKDVIDEIGPPDSLSIGPLSSGGLFVTDCCVRFYWIDRQLEMLYMDSDSYKVCKQVENTGYKPMPSIVIHQIWIWDIYEKIGIPWSGFAEEK